MQAYVLFLHDSSLYAVAVRMLSRHKSTYHVNDSSGKLPRGRTNIFSTSMVICINGNVYIFWYQ